MAEEPEQVQEQDRVSAAFRNEESGAEITVGQQHRDRTCKNRNGQQQQERGDKHRPDEERHLVKRHARGAHVEDRGDEVRRAEDRGNTGKVKREDRQIHRHAGGAGAGRQRRIDRPSDTGTAIHDGGQQQQDEGRRQQPEGNIVHSRKRHVGRADHDRNKPVAETADQSRHDHEKDHDQAVGRGEHVPDMPVFHILNAGLHQLHAHVYGQTTTDKGGEDREHDIHRADILMVGRVKPAAHEAGRCTMVSVGVSTHYRFLCANVSSWPKPERSGMPIRLQVLPPETAWTLRIPHGRTSAIPDIPPPEGPSPRSACRRG